MLGPVPVAQLVGRQPAEEAALLAPRRPLTVHPSGRPGARVVVLQGTGQVTTAVRDARELVEHAQAQGVVVGHLARQRPQVLLDGVEVLLRLEHACHDGAHLGLHAPQAEPLGKHRHLGADDGGIHVAVHVDEGLQPRDEHPHPSLVGHLADQRHGLVGEGEGVDRQVDDACAEDERGEQVGAHLGGLCRARDGRGGRGAGRWRAPARRPPWPRRRPAGSARRARGRPHRASRAPARSAGARPADRRPPSRPRLRHGWQRPPSAGRRPQRRGGRARRQGRGRGARPARRHTPGGGAAARPAGACRRPPRRGERGGRCRPEATTPRGRGARRPRRARPRASRRAGRPPARAGRARGAGRP